MYEAIIEKLKNKGYSVVGEGRNRITLTRNKISVVKIPKNADGEIDNQHEAMCFKSGDNPELAKCKLLKGYITVMEYIKPTFEGQPDWAGFYDCEQVGLNHKGEWKAYDYGCF